MNIPQIHPRNNQTEHENGGSSTLLFEDHKSQESCTSLSIRNGFPHETRNEKGCDE